MTLLSSGIDMFCEYEPWEYDTDICKDDDDVAILKWVYNIHRTPHEMFEESGRSYDLIATAGYDECGEISIYITVVIKQGAWLKKIDVDYAELLGVVSHEIHHITQSEDLLSLPYNGESDNEELIYFLEPSEVEAFHIGFRAQCSVSGEDMRTAILAYLAYRALSDKQKDLVVDTWTNATFA